MFEQSLVNVSSANTAYMHLLSKPVRTDLLLSDRWQIQLKHAPARC